MKRLMHAAAAALLFSPTGCWIEENPPRNQATGPDSATIAQAEQQIDDTELLQLVRDLSADSMGGRAPATPGEEKTIAMLVAGFEAAGLEPGNPDGGWTQDVPLIGFTSRPTGSLTVGGRTVALTSLSDFVAVSRHFQPEVTVDDSELVFVGYGVQAPEFDWDDYKGQDMTGKTLVMLINDPPVTVAGDTMLDDSVFRGNAMTYYGRWSYKYEIASELGADAVLIVHETGPAGYPFEVVSGSWGRENFDIRSDGAADERIRVEGWITEAKARELMRAAGQDFDALKQQARTREFQPVALNGTADLRVTNEWREVDSRNVVARLPGGARADEVVVYTAHWDHLGIDPSLTDDSIFNGALDNATGTAALVELAQAFAALPEPPARSIVFLAVTAEEKGLLGAKYYAENPLYPLEQTAANINIDGLNQWGPTDDVVVIGQGNSTLEDVLADVARATGRSVVADPEPEKGFYYRSDHFEFAKQGVSALYVDAGTSYRDRAPEYGQQKRDEYTANDYHKPSDEVQDDWDLAGAVEDLRMLFRIGLRVANDAALPEWYEGTEFKARRDAMLGATR